MLSASNQLRQVIEESVSASIYADVSATFELNGYRDATVDFPDSLNDSFFPAESVLRVRRPGGGLPKFVVGDAKAVDTSISSETYTKDKIWYRAPSKDSKYKYFRTLSLSSESATSGSYLFESPQIMTVEYPQPIRINSIVVGFEYANSLPSSVQISIYDNNQWISIGSYQPDNKGMVYITYDGQWEEGYVANKVYTTVNKIKVEVAGMQDPGAAIELIQISPRINLDLTDRIINISQSITREEVGLSNPIGTSSANSGAIFISNNDGVLSNDNEDSPVFGLIDVNVEFNVKAMVKVADGYEYLDQGKWYVNSWQYDSLGGVTVDVSDRAKFLQNDTMTRSFYKEKDQRFVIADILEKNEIVDYSISYTSQDLERAPKYVFFNDDTTVWEALQSLAVAEQAAFYFDESGAFVWKSRDTLWQDDEPDLEIISRAAGQKLPNLVNLSYSHQMTANKATVSWTPTDILKRGDKFITNFLWESSESTTLFTSPLQEDLGLSDSYIVVDSEDFDFFPDEGIVNIGSEFIRYQKAQPADFDGEDAPQYALYITERGIFNSSVQDHKILRDEEYWQFDRIIGDLVQSDGEDPEQVYVSFEPGLATSGMFFNQDSKLTILSTISDHTNISRNISIIDDSFDIYGCQIRFPETFDELNGIFYDGDGIGGIFINADDGYRGYYFEIINSEYSSETQNKLQNVRIWKFENAGNGIYKKKILAGYYPEDILTLEEDELEEILGADMNIVPGKDYKLVVSVSQENIIIEEGTYRSIVMSFSVNGKRIFSYRDIEKDGNEIYLSGKWGVFTRANTEAEFEYIYGIRKGRGNATTSSRSQIAIRDELNGGFVDNSLEFSLTERNALNNDFLFDDFGSWVREVKEFDVVHEIFPSISSKLFISNESNIYLIYHKRDQFSSRFAIANRTREPVVIVGSDINLNSDMTVAVYGVPLLQQEVNEYKKSNDNSVWRRGPEEIIIQSQWIQSEAHAKSIAEWVVQRWSTPADIVNVEIAIDPRIQVGDLATVSLEDNSITPETHKFRVVGIEKTLGDSPVMALSLQRVYI